MTIESAIARFRARQAEQFSDEATVTRRFEATYGRDEGYVQPTTTIYAGVCKIRPAEQRGTEAGIGERERGLLDFSGKFPVDTPILRGDVVDVTSSTYDAGMAGQRFHVTDVLYDAWQIARVVALELVAVNEETGS